MTPIPIPNMGNRNQGSVMPVAMLMPRQPSDTAAQLANWPRTFWTIRGSPVSGTRVPPARPLEQDVAGLDVTVTDGQRMGGPQGIGGLHNAPPGLIAREFA